MKKEKKYQNKILMIALLEVVGLTIGFAAFTSSLRIKTRLSVNPNKGTFNVKFSKEANSLVEDNVIPTKSSDIFEAFEGIIDNSGIPTISDLGGEFTQPGESITYEFYAINMGEHKAYLTDVIFGNVDGENTNKVCTSLDGTHQSEINEACNKISMKVTVDRDVLTTSRSNLVGHELDSRESEKVKVEIKYSESAVLPEVPFSVEFGDISMMYNSLEGNSIEPNTGSTEIPDTCYLSFNAGYVDYYNPQASDCDGSAIIPEALPVTQLTATYNEESCLSYANSYVDSQSGLIPQTPFTPEQFCNYIESEYNQQVQQNFVPFDILTWVYFAFDLSFGETGTVPVTITKIGPDAYNDKGITSIVIPGRITEIGESAFEDNNLTSITIPDSVTSIGASAFKNNKINSLSLGSGLVEIEDEAFLNNELISVTIPNSVTSIGDLSFGTNYINALSLGSGLITIGDRAFFVNRLTSVTIPDSVTTIESGAFIYNNLTSVEIGSGIQTIGESAFSSSITTSGDKPDAGDFGPNQLTSVIIHVPSSNAESLTSNGQFGWADGYSNSNIVWSD